jgi:hypothetical protein
MLVAGLVPAMSELVHSRAVVRRATNQERHTSVSITGDGLVERRLSRQESLNGSFLQTMDLHSFDGSIMRSKETSDIIQKAASVMPDGVTKKFLQSFRVCGNCKNFKRIGEDNDGGYLMCQDHVRPGKIKAAYSVGVQQHDKFSLDLYNWLHVPVHQLDCTVDIPAQNCPACHFYKVCLKGANGGGALGESPWTLSQVMEKTNTSLVPDRSLLLKMDIESAEWNVLAEGGSDLKKFNQIAIEFHRLHDTKLHKWYLEAMNELFKAGFTVLHIHGNNMADNWSHEGFPIPGVLEVTFGSEEDVLPTCLTNIQRHRLDQTNNPRNPRKTELPSIHLP